MRHSDPLAERRVLLAQAPRLVRLPARVRTALGVAMFGARVADEAHDGLVAVLADERGALPSRMHVRPVRTSARLLPSLDEISAPRPLDARDAGKVLEHGVVKLEPGRLIEELPPPAADAPARRLSGKLAPEPEALRAVLGTRRLGLCGHDCVVTTPVGR